MFALGERGHDLLEGRRELHRHDVGARASSRRRPVGSGRPRPDRRRSAPRPASVLGVAARPPVAQPRRRPSRLSECAQRARLGRRSGAASSSAVLDMVSWSRAFSVGIADAEIRQERAPGPPSPRPPRRSRDRSLADAARHGPPDAAGDRRAACPGPPPRAAQTPKASAMSPRWPPDRPGAGRTARWSACPCRGSAAFRSRTGRVVGEQDGDSGRVVRAPPARPRARGDGASRPPDPASASRPGRIVDLDARSRSRRAAPRRRRRP